MSDICVAHLVRKANGIAPFHHFLDSYRRHDAGVDHHLVMILKGFETAAEITEYQAALDGMSYQTVAVPDAGFDIEPYFHIARHLDYRYFCFLNSFSVILDQGWLDKLHRAIGHERVGVVGASGSWASHYSLLFQPGTESVAPATEPARGASAASHLPLTTSRRGGSPAPANMARTVYNRLFRSFYNGVVRRGHSALADAHLRRQFKRRFAPFPACHLRTNAFLIAGDTLRRIKPGPLRTKLDAWQFESGHENLTQQVQAMGLTVLVAGRNGQGYGIEEWPESNTFWQGQQENLLVADNQTTRYERSDLDVRTILSRLAWGARSRPQAPTGGAPEARAEVVTAQTER